MTDTNVINSENTITGKSSVSIEADEEVLAEIGYGIVGRGMDIHDNPDDDHEDVARALREIGMNILNHHGEVEADDYQFGP